MRGVHGPEAVCETIPNLWIQTTVHSEDSEAWWWWYGHVSPMMVLGLFIAPGLMDQFAYVKIPSEVMLHYAEEDIPLKWVF